LITGDYLQLQDVTALVREWLGLVSQIESLPLLQELTGQLAEAAADLQAEVLMAVTNDFPELKGLRELMATTQEKYDRMLAEVRESKSVMLGASIALRGVQQRINDEVAAALALGATPAMVEGFETIATDLDASNTDLAEAIVLGTPSADDPMTLDPNVP
jgi:hypothetical protein